MRWLGVRKDNKNHGSIVTNFFEKNLALQIEKGGLFYESNFMKGAHYVQAPTQCFNCLEVGHTANFCKNSPLCSKCGDEHNSKECDEYELDSQRCSICIKNYKENHPDLDQGFDYDDLKFRHIATGASCPLR